MGFEVVQGLGTLLSFEFRVPGFEFGDRRNSISDNNGAKRADFMPDAME